MLFVLIRIVPLLLPAVLFSALLHGVCCIQTELSRGGFTLHSVLLT